MKNLRIRGWQCGITALAVVSLVRLMPGWGAFYARQVYPVVGTVLSRLSGLFPFALGDVFIAVSIVWVIAYPLYVLVWGKKPMKMVFGRVMTFLICVYVWFYVAWGFNYSQPDIYSRIGMHPAEVSADDLKTFAYRYVDSLNATYTTILAIDEETTRKTVADGLERLGGNTSTGARRLGLNAPITPDPHAKTMFFSWLSSMAGITGSMGPFFCEFTLNGDLQPHEYPATYAHEYSHFLGVANEGEANFYSYLMCTSSSDRATRFSGYYQILYLVLANVRHILGEKETKRLQHRIRPEIIRMTQSDRKYWEAKRRSLIDETQNLLFECYLRGNRVKEGRKSYSGVVALLLSWQKRKNV